MYVWENNVFDSIVNCLWNVCEIYTDLNIKISPHNRWESIGKTYHTLQCENPQCEFLLDVFYTSKTTDNLMAVFDSFTNLMKIRRESTRCVKSDINRRWNDTHNTFSNVSNCYCNTEICLRLRSTGFVKQMIFTQFFVRSCNLSYCGSIGPHSSGLLHWKNCMIGARSEVPTKAVVNWGQDKMTEILQTTFSHAFSSMKICVF